MPFISITKSQQAVLRLVVQPKAKRTMFVGYHDNMVKLAVAAPPVDGKANKEVIAYLARFFGLRKNEVQIVSGQRSKKKVCALGQLSASEIRTKILSFLAPHKGA